MKLKNANSRTSTSPNKPPSNGHERPFLKIGGLLSRNNSIKLKRMRRRRLRPIDRLNSNYKLPILTKVELVNCSLVTSEPETGSDVTSSSSSSVRDDLVVVDSNVNATTSIPGGGKPDDGDDHSLSPTSLTLFNDYLLISSKTKYKYLLYSLFEQVKLENKQNYFVVDGYLKLKNWRPINLNSINSIAQFIPTVADDDKGTKTSVINGQREENSKPSESGKEVNESEPDAEKSKNDESPKPAKNEAEIQKEETKDEGEKKDDPIGNNDDGESCASDDLSSIEASDNESIVLSDNSRFSQLTVYDLLSHVVSFLSITIRVKLKNENKNVSLHELVNSQQRNNSDNKKEMAKKQRLLLQSYLMKSIQQRQQRGDKTSTASSPSSASCSSPTVTADSLISSTHNSHAKLRTSAGGEDDSDDDEDDEDDDDDADDDIMAAASNGALQAAGSTAISQKKFDSSALSAASASFGAAAAGLASLSSANLVHGASNIASLYSNPQLVNLLPLFNLPIVSQLLNGINNSNNGLNRTNGKDTNKLLSHLKTNGSADQFGAIDLTMDNTTSPTSYSSRSSTASSTNSSSSLKPGALNFITPGNHHHHVGSHHHLHQLGQKTSSTVETASNEFNSNNNDVDININKLNKNSILLLSSSLKKQRERTTFDPQEEITRLMQIFEKTHHPTRYQIANICDMLNGLACRKDKKPLEPYNIQYWFKNARAALRRKFKEDKVKSDDILLAGFSGAKSPSNDSNNDDLDYDANFNLNFDSDFNPTHQRSQFGGKNENQDQLKSSQFEYQEDELSNDGGPGRGSDNPGYGNEQAKPLNLTSNNNSNANMSSTASQPSGNGRNNSSGSGFRRNRVFIDPITEVPVLEHYFSVETYPDHYLIEKICDILNKGEYRFKFPKLEPRNIQLWFKNHRAKLKRLKTGGGGNSAPVSATLNTTGNSSSNVDKFNKFGSVEIGNTSKKALNIELLADEGNEASDAGNFEDEEEDANFEENDYDYDEYPECDANEKI